MKLQYLKFSVKLIPSFLTITSPAFASSGGGLPWEKPLQQIQESITGPVAGFIALAAVAIAGAMLIFGGELNDFARRLIYVVLVAGILLGATQIVGLFSATGATVASLAHISIERSIDIDMDAPRG